MADEQDRAEGLDEDKIGEFPPDKLLGAAAYGAAGTDPGAPESVTARAAREEPEEMPLESLAEASDPDAMVLSDDDPLAGDPSRRDIATEKGDVVPAEEAAMHMVDEELPGFDSEVDDPALEAAWETDPEVTR